MMDFRAWLEKNPEAKGNMAARCHTAREMKSDLVGLRLQLLIAKIATSINEYPEAAADDMEEPDGGFDST